MKRKIINSIILYLAIMIIMMKNWTIVNFNFSSFDQILFTLNNAVGNASKDIIMDFILYNIIGSLIVLAFVILGCYIWHKVTKNNTTLIKLKIFKKEFTIDVFHCFLMKISYFIPIIILFVVVNDALTDLFVYDYIEGNIQMSTLFEENYVNPMKVDVVFPEEKQNLIYIYLESMESTFIDYANGGNYNVNYIPELTQLAKKNINFSHTDLIGGAYQINASSWTIAAMMAHTSGIPYKTIFGDGNLDYSKYDGFMPGAYSIGEILQDNGYSNYLMVGSASSFGGRAKYFTQHGNYTIYDLYTAREDNLIADDYYVFWGYEDELLIKYAKDKLTNIASKNEPFNFTMLTVDTHTPNGYLSDFCEEVSDNAYLNSIVCSSKQVYDFVKWIQEQDFYENTTIILVGDHLSMNTYSFEDIYYYDRKIYNTYINSVIDTDCSKNRSFNSFDFYPTALAAIGAQIEGERLGLGTNLFSCEETLTEKYSNDYINEELAKTSTYYIQCILNGTC